ncbi:pilus assembly protein [Hyphococcus flavus]|uniref:Pilus assembly protein n=1 Tax=Hyphococcus flavus TaxID=1866326 RepID=A0AAF0CEF1_9PROT|nr:TadE family protein [Hyphococcus flavus]WDI31166.1 pilus assembly protein [Hyphococcus flavus]
MLRFNMMHKLKRRRQGFRSDADGSTAVEFAIVAPLFLTIMFSIFEVGWFYFANSVVDASVGDMARLVKTGQVQGWDGTDEEKYDDLYDRVCKIVKSFGGCENRLTLEVDTFDTFSDLAANNTPPTCADAPPEDLAALPFDPGEELQIIRVRVCYIYTTLNPAIGVNLAEPGTNQRRIISTMIFRNEPYELNNREED